MPEAVFIVANADWFPVRAFDTLSAAEQWIASAKQDYFIERLILNDSHYEEGD